MTINDPPDDHDTPLPDGEQTVTYSTTLAARTDTRPFSWAANGLPAGLTISRAGVISGTADGGGRRSRSTSRVSDNGGGSDAADVHPQHHHGPDDQRVVVARRPGRRRVSAEPVLTGSGGIPPYTWTQTGLPAGLSMSSAGSDHGHADDEWHPNVVTFTIHDSNGGQTSKNISITIGAAPSITTASLPSPRLAGQVYPNTTLAATGGTAPYTLVGVEPSARPDRSRPAA